ncbi:hypothetical protein CQJ94_23165 [Glycomyces fuscus]|nr:hypothetical protein CQJ94_23165 [Glycomyces fuscus]
MEVVATAVDPPGFGHLAHGFHGTVVFSAVVGEDVHDLVQLFFRSFFGHTDLLRWIGIQA